MRLILTASIATTAACQGNGTFFAAAVDGGGCLGCGGFGAFGGTGVVGGTGAVGFDAGSNVDGGGGQGAPWNSPFPNMGAPGFRNSTDTLCAELAIDGNAIDVWSDERGVFALVTGTTSTGADADAGSTGCAGNPCGVERLLHHDGNGWQLQSDYVGDGLSTHVDSVGLRGTALSALFIRRRKNFGGLPRRCALSTIEAGSSHCAVEESAMVSLFAVTPSLAYALEVDTLNVAYLRRFDGTEWRPRVVTRSGMGAALWADSTQVLVVDGNHPFATPFEVSRRANDGTWSNVGGPLIGRATALWALAADDVWVGTEDGAIWHFDGQAWQQMGSLGGVTCPAVTPIRGIWGSGESVYFYSATALQRWNGASFESLVNWSCAFGGSDTDIHDLWGNSEHEVFIGLREVFPSSDTCGGSIVVRFDGTQFHRM